jgi:hypothetical protein
MIRRAVTISILATIALATSAASARAAVTLGEAGAPAATCGGNVYMAQTGVAGPPGYSVPSGYGVITSWSIQGATAPGTGKFLVWRPTGIPDQYILFRQSPIEAFVAGSVATFSIHFPVQPDDIIGLETTQNCLVGAGLGDVVRWVTIVGNPADGSVHTLNNVIPQARLQVSARVEADADHDGFSDEPPEDQCPTSASTQGPCSTPPVAPVPRVTAITKKQCKKKKHRSAASAKKKKCKKGVK